MMYLHACIYTHTYKDLNFKDTHYKLRKNDISAPEKAWKNVQLTLQWVSYMANVSQRGQHAHIKKKKRERKGETSDRKKSSLNSKLQVDETGSKNAG